MSCLTLILLIAFAVSPLNVHSAGDDDKRPTAPARKDGRKWRIGYVQGGPYLAYGQYFRRVIQGLMDLGWIARGELPPPEKDGDNRHVWEWLASEAKSEWIEFAADAYWSSNWDKELREKTRAEVIPRLAKKQDIDIVIAMGTWAGQDLANDLHTVPTVVMCTSNPVESGIIPGIEDSGRDHVHAKISPERYVRQVRLFHEIIGFKRLGVVYEDTPVGRTYAALNDIRKAASERGFEVVECRAPGDLPDKRQSFENLLACHRELAPKVDAMYLTIHNGLTLDHLPELLEPFNEQKIPTFAQRSAEEVRHGVLMSMPSAVTQPEALFGASVLARIMNGAVPRRLGQVFEESVPRIALNMAVARKIGYDPPGWVLHMADELYTEIETSK
ncbi:MAG: ABC transporter substrate-binding protein [Acidobacteriota bacterium]